MNKLNVKAVFKSIDGEANGFGTMGEISTFIRLAGCSLKCNYCDTAYAQHPSSGTIWGIGKVLDAVYDLNNGFAPSKVTITGGEPFEQIEGVNNLIYLLLNGSSSGYTTRITVETNGVHRIKALTINDNKRQFIRIVMDYKGESLCELKGDEADTRSENMRLISNNHVVKFIVGDEEDYKHVLRIWYETDAKKVLAPVHGKLDPSKLVEWMIRDGLNDVRMQIQLHKYIWPECIGTEVER